MQAIALAAGLGLTVDTVLLIALAEQRNRRVRQGWMMALASSAWCWHAGAAIYFLLESTPVQTAQPVRWAAMSCMVVGLLGMPCSLMHAIVRLATTGWFGAPQRRGYEPFLYAPVFLSVPIALSFHPDPVASFLQQVSPLVLPYLGATTGISLLAAVVLWRAARSSDLPAGRPFLHGLSFTLIAMTITLDVILLIAIPRWPDTYVVCYILLVLLPTPPAILFAYFVLRYGFLPLVVERTVVYGGILAGLVLVHRSLVAPLEAAWHDQVGFDLVWLEIALGVLLIGGYQPFRRRVREAVRYLTSTSVRQFRREVRQLSIDLASRGGNTPDELAAWFVRALQQLSGVAAVQIVVNDRSSEFHREVFTEPLCSRAMLDQITAEWPGKVPVLFADQAPNRRLTEELLRSRVSIMIRTEHESLQNLWCLRATPGGEGWDEEELNALVLLSEQWIAAVRHTIVQAARTAAERRAWQAEKFSALGLLAGSLAHEIKNPLSSIKTLATVALEESPPASEQAESLRLVLQEIDRLARTTQQLLGFVRPETSSSNGRGTDVGQIVKTTTYIVQHRAKQQQVRVTLEMPCVAVLVLASREALQSLLLNLVLNAVEACSAEGTVTVSVASCAATIVIEVRDTGPGIPPEIQDRLFQPLTTTKADGTGLGLYSVAQTVRDLHGEIAVESRPERGTVFRVTLPAFVDVESTTP